MTFVDLYGEQLDIQLSSADRTGAFATARRKREVNNGMREFVRVTECVKKNGTIAVVDGQATYDLEASFSDYWFLSKAEGISIAITNGTTTRYLVEGKHLTRVDKRRLDREHPNWRAATATTPKIIYIDEEGGTTLLGLYPPLDLQSGETATITVPYVPEVADMSGDSDEPWTFAGNVVKRLRPWRLACSHYAAYKLEWARKSYTSAKEQLAFFNAFVKDYFDKQEIPGGDVVAFAHDYYAPTRKPAFSGDPMVEW